MKTFNILKNNKRSQSGFTLVELSIVLVIIGIIISSVLVGQDLVRSAELRSTITQLEGFNSAIGTFKGKYNGLPGDVAGATNFGFTGDGNGDGTLDAATSLAADSTGSIGENVNFWNHLGSSGAGLISGSYAAAAVTENNIAAELPSAKAGNYWGVFNGPPTTTIEATTSGSEAGTNYYLLGVVGEATAGRYTTAATLTPLEAQNVDSKIDDGKPSTGLVRARGVASGGVSADIIPTNAVAGATTTCTSWVATSYVTAIATNTYTTKATTALCTLRIKMPL